MKYTNSHSWNSSTPSICLCPPSQVLGCQQEQCLKLTTTIFPVLSGAVSFQAPMESHNNCYDYPGTYNMLSNNHILFDICMVCFYILILTSRASEVALVVKNLSADAGDVRGMGLTPESGRFPGSGCGSPLQYSCLENPSDRGAWWATVHGVAKSRTCLNWLSTNTLASIKNEIGEIILKRHFWNCILFPIHIKELFQH